MWWLLLAVLLLVYVNLKNNIKIFIKNPYLLVVQAFWETAVSFFSVHLRINNFFIGLIYA